MLSKSYFTQTCNICDLNCNSMNDRATGQIKLTKKQGKLNGEKSMHWMPTGTPG